MSWLGIFEGIMLAYDFIRVNMLTPRLVILLAILNLVLYFLMTKDLRRFHPKEFARRANYRKATGQGGSFFDRFNAAGGGKNQGTRSSGGGQNPGPKSYTKIYPNGARHKCTICGRTELDGDRLEFRFCSKCEGDHEYCQDHLFTHQHIRNGVPGGPD
jgi:hypothetical protein